MPELPDEYELRAGQDALRERGLDGQAELYAELVEAERRFRMDAARFRAILPGPPPGDVEGQHESRRPPAAGRAGV